MSSMTNLVEEILKLIWKECRIEVDKIQFTFNLTRETTSRIINFLLEFGFIEFYESNRYLGVSEPCRKFFDEDIGQSHRKTNASPMIVFL